MTTTSADLRPREADPLTPDAQGMPVDSQALPPGALACVACGIAVRGGTGPVITLDSFGRTDLPVPSPPSAARREAEWTFSVCPACAELRRRAVALVAADPRYLARTGSEDVAIWRVETALSAVAALGHHLPEPADLAMLTEHLSAAGARARWAHRFVPLHTAGGRPGSCSPFAWACVPSDQRAALRAGYAALLAARIATTRPDVALAPPPIEASRLQGATVPIPGGCLVCGVGVVMATATRVTDLGGPRPARSAVWRPVTVAGPDSLGGRHGPERIEGYACPACADAVAWVGSIGPDAMERALVQHLRSIGRGEDADRLLRADAPGVVGWGAVTYDARRRGLPTPKPNQASWEHLMIG